MIIKLEVDTYSFKIQEFSLLAISIFSLSEVFHMLFWFMLFRESYGCKNVLSKRDEILKDLTYFGKILVSSFMIISETVLHKKYIRTFSMSCDVFQLLNDYEMRFVTISYQQLQFKISYSLF